jgi:acyl-CoA thioester hydrolase
VRTRRVIRRVQPAAGLKVAAADDGSTLTSVSPPFRHRLRVRYSECDLQGVVFNANYLTYLDETMTELFRSALNGGYAAMVEAGVDMVVAETTLRYLAPARFDDEIEVEATIIRLGTTAMTTAMRVTRAGEPLTEAELRHVFVRAAEGGKTPMPDSVREALEPWSPSG